MPSFSIDDFAPRADEYADESFYAGPMAIMGCLRAISAVLASVSALPHLYAQMEGDLLPMIAKLLSTDGQVQFIYCFPYTYYFVSIRKYGYMHSIFDLCRLYS